MVYFSFADFMYCYLDNLGKRIPHSKKENFHKKEKPLLLKEGKGFSQLDEKKEEASS